MRGGITMPRDGSADFLCGSCARDLQSRGLAGNAGLKKPRQLVFRDLCVSQDQVCEEVLNFLAMKRYLNPKVDQQPDRIVIAAPDLAVVISGSPDCITVSAGPRVVTDPGIVATLTVLTGPVALLGKLAGVAYDKKRIENLLQFLDERLRARSTASTRHSEGVSQRMRELSELRDEGIISAEEYETKKAKLLEQL